MNLKKIGRGIVRAARNDPGATLAVIAIVAPGLARKAAPIVGAMLSTDEPR